MWDHEGGRPTNAPQECRATGTSAILYGNETLVNPRGTRFPHRPADISSHWGRRHCRICGRYQSDHAQSTKSGSVGVKLSVILGTGCSYRGSPSIEVELTWQSMYKGEGPVHQSLAWNLAQIYVAEPRPLNKVNGCTQVLTRWNSQSTNRPCGFIAGNGMSSVFEMVIRCICAGSDLNTLRFRKGRIEEV